MNKELAKYRHEVRESYTDLDYCFDCRVFHEIDEMGQRDLCKYSKTYQINQTYAEIVVKDLVNALVEMRK
jgi:ribosomal protein S26